MKHLEVAVVVGGAVVIVVEELPRRERKTRMD